MSRMRTGTKIAMVFGMTTILTFPVTVVSGAGSPSKKVFTASTNEALHYAREADAAGARGGARTLTARQALEKAKEGQRANHNERLNEGM